MWLPCKIITELPSRDFLLLGLIIFIITEASKSCSDFENFQLLLKFAVKFQLQSPNFQLPSFSFTCLLILNKQSNLIIRASTTVQLVRTRNPLSNTYSCSFLVKLEGKCLFCGCLGFVNIFDWS